MGREVCLWAGTKSKLIACISIVLSVSLLMPMNAFALDDEDIPPSTGVEDEATGITDDDPLPGEGVPSDVPADPTLTPEGLEDDEAAASAEDVAISPLALTPPDLAAAGWTEYTGFRSADIVAFDVAGQPNLTGYLGIGAPYGGAGGELREAAYYVQHSDGVNITNVTYAFLDNSFGTSEFAVFVAGPTGYERHDIADTAINSIWTKEVTPGYTSLLLEGVYTSATVSFQINVTMIPNSSGIVQYEWSITNLGSDVDIVTVFSIDTELQGEDYVPLYSLGTDRGIYMDASHALYRFHFPAVPESAGGPADYATVQWATPITTVYGPNLDAVHNRGVARAVDEIMLDGVDSALFFRYAPVTLRTGETRDFVYKIGLDLTDPPVQQASKPLLAPTGDHQGFPFMYLVGGACVGLALLVVSRRFFQNGKE